MDRLTERQKQLYRFIGRFQMKHGKSPTLKEMKRHMRVASDNGILKHLAALEKKKYIQRDKVPRGIKLLSSVRKKLHSDTVSVPILGAVPAGGPILTESYIEGWKLFDSGGLKNAGSAYLLRVTGDSMINAGIYEGDLLLVDPKKKERPGDIVIALVDGENTVKRLVKEKNGWYYLKSENPDYEDVHPIEDLETQGVVIGLTRTYN